ncbi:iron-sulfur cluster biosynthesis family protein [Gottfriedia solisilvae]|uniref:Core domain-containing protein n=1 Tax=Gottfriedia solisilvae TaxID=1516104 RepID=A0A8J3AQN9_9BACI|nr:iron-sulfur cluster biosynthesis family protein [Gottfriedia solisilvae]GGI17999.1 hypothetical protein GCM10007380_40740 [Gottfriedia solisilvae]
MNITITEHAKNQLDQLVGKSPNHKVFLHYEMGGCGSPLDGVLRIKLIKSIDGLHQIQSNGMTIYINKNTINFLDDDLVIDYTDGFHIKSSNQIYSYKIGIEIEA